MLRGQQDVPWLRRQGSKNSRKFLYFVERAQECNMSASFCLASVTFWIQAVCAHLLRTLAWALLCDGCSDPLNH